MPQPGETWVVTGASRGIGLQYIVQAGTSPCIARAKLQKTLQLLPCATAYLAGLLFVSRAQQSRLAYAVLGVCGGPYSRHQMRHAHFCF